jgi:hypothetical protein
MGGDQAVGAESKGEGDVYSGCGAGELKVKNN